MTFDAVIARAEEALRMFDDADRNGVVGARGYDDRGRAIGGRYTWAAVALGNEADDLLRSIGIENYVAPEEDDP